MPVAWRVHWACMQRTTLDDVTPSVGLSTLAEAHQHLFSAGCFSHQNVLEFNRFPLLRMHDHVHSYSTFTAQNACPAILRRGCLRLAILSKACKGRGRHLCGPCTGRKDHQYTDVNRQATTSAFKTRLLLDEAPSGSQPNATGLVSKSSTPAAAVMARGAQRQVEVRRPRTLRRCGCVAKIHCKFCGGVRVLRCRAGLLLVRPVPLQAHAHHGQQSCGALSAHRPFHGSSAGRPEPRGEAQGELQGGHRQALTPLHWPGLCLPSITWKPAQHPACSGTVSHNFRRPW